MYSPVEDFSDYPKQAVLGRAIKCNLTNVGTDILLIRNNF